MSNHGPQFDEFHAESGEHHGGALFDEFHGGPGRERRDQRGDHTYRDVTALTAGHGAALGRVRLAADARALRPQHGLRLHAARDAATARTARGWTSSAAAPRSAPTSTASPASRPS
jgi:hypothetical protein